MKYRAIKYDNGSHTFYKIEKKWFGFWIFWNDSRTNYFQTEEAVLSKLAELRHVSPSYVATVLSI